MEDTAVYKHCTTLIISGHNWKLLKSTVAPLFGLAAYEYIEKVDDGKVKILVWYNSQEEILQLGIGIGYLLGRKAIPIDKNVPIPALRPGGRVLKYPFNKLLTEKDSFAVEPEQGQTIWDKYNTVKTAAIQYGKRHNKTFVVRVYGKQVRVWLFLK